VPLVIEILAKKHWGSFSTKRSAKLKAKQVAQYKKFPLKALSWAGACLWA